MTPYELRVLADLRRRGKAPELAVFVTDDWQWAMRLMNDGILAIRVRNPRDHGHDWTPLAGLWVILALRRPSSSDLADFSLALLEANPMKLTIYDSQQKRSRDVWEAAA